MKLADYPAQEPLSEAGQAYSAECWRRSEGIVCEEVAFGSSPYQRLSIFEASKPGGFVLLFWHGGGWTSGYKEWMGFMAPALNAAGATLVSGGYRLAPEHVFPAGLDDCLAAVDWVSKSLQGRLFIGGHSAGGHYAALIAARAGGKLVRGCLPLSGVFEFGEGSGLSARPRFLGADQRNDRIASPRFELALPLPPFLVAYGSSDFAHLIPQAQRFVAAVRTMGGEAEQLELAGRTHFTASYAAGEADGPWVKPAVAFMRRTIAPP
jgi:acetyl esterase/lipase